MTHTITTGRTAVRRRGLRNTATLVGAAVVALAAWALSVQAAGVDLTVGTGDAAQTVGPVSVAVTPMLVGGADWALLTLLDKRFRNGHRTWRIIAYAVLALSLFGPVSAGAAGSVLATLVAMHLAVGATIIFGLAPVSQHQAPGD